MRNWPTTDQLQNDYLEYIKDGANMSANLGWIPHQVSVTGKRTTYLISDTYFTVTFMTPATYVLETKIKNEEKESKRLSIPYDKRGKLDPKKLIIQNSLEAKTFLEEP